MGGANYGQGSSREHAALVPLYLGVRAVIAKSFARIHAANLINVGILPLTFTDPKDYDAVSVGSVLRIDDLKSALDRGLVTADIDGRPVTLTCSLTERQRNILNAGGLLKYTGEAKA